MAAEAVSELKIEALNSPHILTRTMQKVLSAIDITMHDHIIVARGGLISLRSLHVLER